MKNENIDRSRVINPKKKPFSRIFSIVEIRSSKKFHEVSPSGVYIPVKKLLRRLYEVETSLVRMYVADF